MAALNTGITRFFDLLFAPSALSPWLGMVVISLLTGFVLLFVFRYTSNQQGIRAAKDRIIAPALSLPWAVSPAVKFPASRRMKGDSSPLLAEMNPALLATPPDCVFSVHPQGSSSPATPPV